MYNCCYRLRRSLRWSCPWVMFSFSVHAPLVQRWAWQGESANGSKLKGKNHPKHGTDNSVFKAGPKLQVWASQWNIVGFYSISILQLFQCLQQQTWAIYHISISSTTIQQVKIITKSSTKKNSESSSLTTLFLMSHSRCQHKKWFCGNRTVIVQSFFWALNITNLKGSIHPNYKDPYFLQILMHLTAEFLPPTQY